MKNFFSFLFLFLISGTLHAAVVTRDVEYKDGKTLLQGFLAYDDAKEGKLPAVIVVHEWKGVNQYAKKRVTQLAELGYVGFAIDIYGKGVRPKDHKEAGEVSGAFRKNRELLRQRAKAGFDFLLTQPKVDPQKIAAIGYCFGGMTVLEMARWGFPLKGVASFHGNLDTPTPAKKGDIKAKIMVFQGGNDGWTLPALEGFKNEMTNAGVDYTVKVFPGVVHSFTVPEAGEDKSTGMAYDQAADKESWAMLENFLKQIFS